MRAAKMLAVLAIAALGIGSFSAVAQAGTRYKATGEARPPWPSSLDSGLRRRIGQNPNFDKSGMVSANGSLTSVANNDSFLQAGR